MTDHPREAPCRLPVLCVGCLLGDESHCCTCPLLHMRCCGRDNCCNRFWRALRDLWLASFVRRWWLAWVAFLAELQNCFQQWLDRHCTCDCHCEQVGAVCVGCAAGCVLQCVRCPVWLMQAGVGTGRSLRQVHRELPPVPEELLLLPPLLLR